MKPLKKYEDSYKDALVQLQRIDRHINLINDKLRKVATKKYGAVSLNNSKKIIKSSLYLNVLIGKKRSIWSKLHYLRMIHGLGLVDLEPDANHMEIEQNLSQMFKNISFQNETSETPEAIPQLTSPEYELNNSGDGNV